MNVTSIDISL